MTLTETERIILENTDEQYKYIARDSNGDLYLFSRKPKKLKSCWMNTIYSEFYAFNHLFQDIKWEDKKPYKFR